MARSQQWYEDLSQSKRRRVQARMLAKGALVGVVILVGYYVLPLDSPGISGTLVLAGGLLLATGAVAWRVRTILNSPFPRVGAYEGLLMGIPFMLCVFAASYYLVGLTQVDSFTQSMNKVGAMYFTVTVFSTIGFGDITPKTDLARNLVTVQMIITLVVIGLVVKLLTAAVNVGLKRQSAKHPNPEPDPGQSAPATG